MDNILTNLKWRRLYRRLQDPQLKNIADQWHRQEEKTIQPMSDSTQFKLYHAAINTYEVENRRAKNKGKPQQLAEIYCWTCKRQWFHISQGKKQFYNFLFGCLAHHNSFGKMSTLTEIQLCWVGEGRGKGGKFLHFTDNYLPVKGILTELPLYEKYILPYEMQNRTCVHHAKLLYVYFVSVHSYVSSNIIARNSPLTWSYIIHFVTVWKLAVILCLTVDLNEHVSIRNGEMYIKKYIWPNISTSFVRNLFANKPPL